MGLFGKSLGEAIGDGVKSGLEKSLPSLVHKAMDDAVEHHKEMLCTMIEEDGKWPAWLGDSVRRAGYKVVCRAKSERTK